MDTHDEVSIPFLPSGCSLTYVDEGAANVVYKINLRPLTPPASALDTYEGGTPPPTEVEFGEDPNAIFQSKLSEMAIMDEV